MLVEDETDYTFEYDLNGAMTYDGKNRVTLTRNILGQPYLLEQAGGACVEFSYLADGTKRYMVADTSQHEPVFSNPYVDYGARYYDPTVARWHRPDPMADKYPDTSPYAFCANDPVNFVDWDGQVITDYFDSSGNTTERFRAGINNYYSRQQQNKAEYEKHSK